ncbi:MAG TPA: tetratricopeptide repeat protein [Terriglobales bacterium]|nr:tetratricopeptide repeat protein [Terriglobales bacterium]
MRAETRRQLKQDKFSKATLQVAEQTVHWSAEHKGKLIAGAVVVVVIVAAILGGFYYLTMQDQKASVEFSKAVQTLSEPIRPAGMPPQPEYPSFASANERATEAHKQFQAIADKYPHTHAGDFAHYFLGVTSSQLGDNVAAERELKSVADYHNADISALAKMALASVYRNTNRNKDAEDLYNQLIQKPTSTVSKTSAQMQLAETYVADGKASDAKKIYEQIQKDAPQSEAAQLASNRLQELK